jgi:hypothetical protein
MKRFFLLLASATVGLAADCNPIQQPCSAAVNFAYDLMGTPDNRPGTWGSAGTQSYKLTFKVPSGYRVRVLRVYGDLTWWPRGTPLPDAGDNVVGHAVGVLLGLSNTAPDGSAIIDGGGASDNCFLYIQDSSKGEKSRAPFDYDTHVGGLLQSDGVLVVKAAVWLNTLGLAVHLEPSMTVVFQFEKQ